MTGQTQQRLRRLSRDTHFLGKAAISIVFVFAALAFVVSQFASHRVAAEPLVSEQSSSDDLANLLRGILRPLAERHVSDDSLVTSITQQILGRLPEGDPARPMMEAFRDSVIERKPADLLIREAAVSPPTRFANAFLGDLAFWDEDYERALTYYRAEAALPDTEYARQQVVRILLTQKKFTELKTTLEDERFLPSDPGGIVELGVRLRDPGLVMKGVVLVDYNRMDPLLAALALFSAAVWFVILFKLCEIPRFRSVALVVALLGVMMGIFSATATLFAVVWQENVWGLQSDGTFVNDLIYVICGIGLREEVVKLLFFLPFVPWLYRRRDPKLVLLVASCVGLGFALQENLGYFAGGQLPVVVRFLTANFLHMGMTGILGYTVVRFLYHPSREWERLLATFIGIVLVHGMYNGFLMIPQFADYSILSFIILIGLAFYYFNLITQLCPKVHPMISPLGIFVIGMALILGFSIVASCWIIPNFANALGNVGQEFLGSFALVALYINRFRDH